jgi:hypothetical protein
MNEREVWMKRMISAYRKSTHNHEEECVKSKRLTIRQILLTSIVGLTLATALLVFGCSSSSNPVGTAGEDFAADFFSREYAEGDNGPQLGPLVSLNFHRDAERVDAESGGAVEFRVSGKNQQFVVAPGAIPADTTITVKVVSLEANALRLLNARIVILDFSPDGLHFNPNATLRFDASVLGKSKRTVNLFWLNPLDNKWESQGEFKVDPDGKVNIPIHHFSKYGIS